MFYVAYSQGFLCVKNTDKGKNKTVPVVDVREATPFPTFDAADTAAKGRLNGYYAVLGIGWRPDPASSTIHHFDVGQGVKIVRGPHDRPLPNHIRPYTDEIGTVTAVDLNLDNEWVYTVELEIGHQLRATALNLTQLRDNQDLHKTGDLDKAPAPEVQQFRFYWLDGVTDVYTGDTPEQAFSNAGFGAGALRSVDFYSKGSAKNYEWDGSTWVKK